MTDDRSLERAARSWLDEGPTRAPDAPVEAALARIHTTPQEGAFWVPRRLTTMNPAARLAGAAVLVLAVVGTALLALKPASTVGPPGSPAPSALLSPIAATPAPTSPLAAGPLAFGTYDGPVLKVADVIASINADGALTPADRNLIIDTLAGIRNKTSLRFSLELRGGQMTQRQTVDGLTEIGSLGRYSFPDDHTLVYTENVNGTEAVTQFELAVDGDSFTLHRTTPVGNAVDDFVTRLIFESGPFTLQ